MSPTYLPGAWLPLTKGQEVYIVRNGVRQKAWVRSCPTIIGGVYTLRASSSLAGEAILRFRHEIEA